MSNTVQLKESIEKLKVAWRELATTLELKTKVSVNQRHRMVACSLDIINFSEIFTETHNQWLIKVENEIKLTEGMSPEERAEYWKHHFKEDMNVINRNAVSYKAMYFFIRALQDAVYGVLLELRGETVGRYTSMSYCLNNENNKINQILTKKFPNYLKWFREFRNQRNKIKEGITYGGAYDSDKNLSINMHIVERLKTPPEVGIDFVLDVNDMIQSVNMSVLLLNFTNNFAIEKTRSV